MKIRYAELHLQRKQLMAVMQKKKKKKIMTVKNPFVDSKYKNDKLNTTKILEKSNTK